MSKNLVKLAMIGIAAGACVSGQMNSLNGNKLGDSGQSQDEIQGGSCTAENFCEGKQDCGGNSADQDDGSSSESDNQKKSSDKKKDNDKKMQSKRKSAAARVVEGG